MPKPGSVVRFAREHQATRGDVERVTSRPAIADVWMPAEPRPCLQYRHRIRRNRQHLINLQPPENSMLAGPDKAPPPARRARGRPEQAPEYEHVADRHPLVFEMRLRRRRLPRATTPTGRPRRPRHARVEVGVEVTPLRTPDPTPGQVAHQLRQRLDQIPVAGARRHASRDRQGDGPTVDDGTCHAPGAAVETLAAEYQLHVRPRAELPR